MKTTRRRIRILIASGALAILTMGGAVSLYQVMFDIWMTAYPLADVNVWRARLVIRVTTTILIGLCWFAIVIWLIRHKRSQEATE